MTDISQSPAAASPSSDIITRFLNQLRRHPKRVVFTEGEDIRVIRAAERLVKEEVIAPILLGDKDRIRALAEQHGVSLKFIHIINPPHATDFDLFCKRVENMDRYRSRQIGVAQEIVARPHYFGALMVQYGQADAIVGGNQAMPASYFRALLHTIKPLPEVEKIFGVSVVMGNHLKNLGRSGLLLLADSCLIPNPSVSDLAMIAIETGRLAQHFLGRRPFIAMLSHSTKGSAGTADAQRVAAAAALAKEEVKRKFLEMDIEGELQADVALDPDAAEVKMLDAESRPVADVLVFPNLDAAHISLKLLQHVAGATTYGQLIMGLSRPAAQIPITASVETIFGTAVAIAVEAIKYHQLYSDDEPSL